MKPENKSLCFESFLKTTLATVLSVSLISVPGLSASSVDPQAKLKAVLEAGREQKTIADMISTVNADSIRHEIDWNIVEIVRKSPVAQAALAKILTQISEFMSEQRIENLTEMAHITSQSEGEFKKIQKIVIQTAEALNFTPAAIKDAHVFISGSSKVNAYTYSPAKEYLDFVVFEGLLTLMRDSRGKLEGGPLQAVIAHELSHVVSGHVINGMVLQAVFNATGEILIPQNQHLAFKEMWRERAASMIRQGLDLPEGKSEELVSGLVKVSESVGAKLKEQVPAGQLIEFSREIMKAVDMKVDASALPTSMEMSEMDKMMKAKEFRKAMVAVTRSQEITADRGALLVSGVDNLAEAMAKLAGGKMASGKDIVRQADDVLSRMSLEEMMQKNLEAADHPSTVFRTAAFKVYMQTLSYRLVQDTFERSINLYLNLSKKLSEAEKQVRGNTGELSMQQKINMQRQTYSDFAGKLSQSIADIVVQDITEAVNSGNEPKYFGRFIKLAEMMQSAGGRYEKLITDKDLGRKDRVFDKIYKGLKAQNNPAGDEAAKIIKSLASKLSISSDLGDATPMSDLMTKIKETKAKQTPALRCAAAL